MTDMENCVMIAGTVMFIAGFIFMFFEYLLSLRHTTEVLPILEYILIIGGFTIAAVAWLHYDNATTEIVSEDMVIQIERMERKSTTTSTGKTVTTHTKYYVYFEDGGEEKRVRVSSSIYSDYEEGDTIVIQEQTEYRIDRDTGERLSIKDVSYNCK